MNCGPLPLAAARTENDGAAGIRAMALQVAVEEERQKSQAVLDATRAALDVENKPLEWLQAMEEVNGEEQENLMAQLRSTQAILFLVRKELERRAAR